jgi:GST-like protein
VIELYACGSPNVLKVMLMLEETELPYRTRLVDVYADEQHAPAFLRLNPNGKLPVIVDDDADGHTPQAVFESGAILLYLAEKTGQFLPRGPLERSECLQWLMLQMASIGPMFGQALHFNYIAPDGNDYARRRYSTEARRLYDVAERRLAESPWLGGRDYSIADIAAWPWLGKYHGYRGFELDLAKFPNLARWSAAIEQRPAYQRIHEPFKALFKAGLAAQSTASADALDRFFGRGKYSRA